MSLTKLQRLGISTLLMNVRNHGCEWLDSGSIEFTNNRVANWCVMFVKVINPEKKITIFQMTLEYSENIDDKIKYDFQYDRYYEIYSITERGYES